MLVRKSRPLQLATEPQLLPNTHIILIGGLGEDREQGLYRFVTARWRKSYNINTSIFYVGWSNNKNTLPERLRALHQTIKSLGKKQKISLAAFSAGGCFALNAFIIYPNDILKIALVCSRLIEGSGTHPSLEWAAKSSPLFKASVLAAEKNTNQLTSQQKKRILTLTALWDEIVPKETSSIGGATNCQVNSIEHVLSIWLTMTIWPNVFLEFLTS